MEAFSELAEVQDQGQDRSYTVGAKTAFQQGFVQVWLELKAFRGSEVRSWVLEVNSWILEVIGVFLEGWGESVVERSYPWATGGA